MDKGKQESIGYNLAKEGKKPRNVPKFDYTDMSDNT